MFNKNSGLVKVWVGLIMAGIYNLEEVPELNNLKEAVTDVIKEVAGDIAALEPKPEEVSVAEKPAAENPVEASVMDESTESQPVNDDPAIDLMAAPETSETEEAIPAEMA